MKETWKPVVGYEGLYEVSDRGNIRGLYARKHKQNLSPAHNRKGYRYVCLHKEGQRKIKKVYRVVAEAFIPNPYHLPEIDHIDGTRDNDVAWNLRWVTHKQNINNPITRERFRDVKIGEKNSFWGRHHSEETKQAISDKKRGMIIVEQEII
jgi:hypothetical protein